MSMTLLSKAWLWHSTLKCECDTSLLRVSVTLLSKECDNSFCSKVWLWHSSLKRECDTCLSRLVCGGWSMFPGPATSQLFWSGAPQLGPYFIRSLTTVQCSTVQYSTVQLGLYFISSLTTAHRTLATSRIIRRNYMTENIWDYILEAIAWSFNISNPWS